MQNSEKENLVILCKFVVYNRKGILFSVSNRRKSLLLH
jgi:hypothetical protein